MSQDFFEFRAKVTAQTRAARVAKADRVTASGGQAKPLSVSELTLQIDSALQRGLPATILVRGEVSNCNLHSASGHLYFTLKDKTACIDCVMWRSDVARLKFDVADGMELIATGGVKVYPDRGRYQLYARSLQPTGIGALELAFRQLQTRLSAEGLFDAARKRALPQYPRRIAIVTSRHTAALQDVLKVLRRFPWLSLCVYHVPVQGDGAATSMVDAISQLSRCRAAIGGCDVILLVRGGGSLEDLWAFNDEALARAIAASVIPIVTGIGHEIDTSIADLVADYHAHTPTEAAQVITANWRTAWQDIDHGATRLVQGYHRFVRDLRQRLLAIERHEAFRRPFDRIFVVRQKLDERERALAMTLGARLRRAATRLAALTSALAKRDPRHLARLSKLQLDAATQRLAKTMSANLQKRRVHLDMSDRHLKAIGPEDVLRRGYSITTRKKDGLILRNAQDVHSGDRLLTRLHKGTIESVADDANQPRLFE